jgi:hypothetical protein
MRGQWSGIRDPLWLSFIVLVVGRVQCLNILAGGRGLGGVAPGPCNDEQKTGEGCLPSPAS